MQKSIVFVIVCFSAALYGCAGNPASEKEPEPTQVVVPATDSIAAELEAIGAVGIHEGWVIIIADGAFKTGKTSLSNDASQVVQKLSETLRVHNDNIVRVEGHTDNTGSPEYNQKLSEERALSVKSSLVENGIADHRILIKGHGQMQPIADNSTKEGRKKNRRVEIIVEK
jgi:outer membrane protein OmpA-like peptidoglycan-associated protein